jgi:hypothetical protein
VQGAWQQVLNEHTILRSSFISDDEGKLLQVVHKEVPLDFRQRVWLPEQNHDDCFKQLLDEDKQERFDLSQAKLLRIYLVEKSSTEFTLILSNHHIILDGWSLPVIFKKFSQYYQNIVSGQPIADGKTDRYSDHIRALQHEDSAATNAFWKNQLQEISSPANSLSTKRQRCKEGKTVSMSCIEC